jgi:hypothetical protein
MALSRAGLDWQGERFQHGNAHNLAVFIRRRGAE